MKRILFFAVTVMAIIALTACGGKKTPEQLIVGNWAAAEPMEMAENGVKITFNDIHSTYNEDNTATSSGTMSLSSSMFSADIEMGIEIESTWLIEGDRISETITDADITMKKVIPGLPDMGKLMADQMKKEGAKWSTIGTLDKTTLVLTEESTGISITMKRQ